MGSEQRKNSLSFIPSWESRDQMVSHALAKSLTWFAFVNGSFALMISLRNVLFGNFDASLKGSLSILSLIDKLMLSVFILSLILLVIPFLLRKYSPEKVNKGLNILLLALGLFWSICCFCFIAYWQLPFAYPLSSILMMCALTALYFYPSGLLSFIVPVWLATVLGSLQINHGVNLNFAVICLIFTLILLYGRYNLLQWFDQAWMRFQENQLLISRLDTLAHQDVLTGTANRRAMENHLNNAISKRFHFDLIMLDVDYFKRYNDCYGHQAGDVCLAEVAAVLKAAVRTPEDLVARYGGEEFVVMLFGTEPGGAERVAERIQMNLKKANLAHEQSDVSDTVTISMGIASSNGSQPALKILAEADAALYRAKERGRNRWCR